MHIKFSEVDDRFIKSQVEAGYYTNETELVRSAVRRMREEQERAARLNALVQQGVQDVEQGNTIAYTPELMEEILQSAIKKAGKGEAYHSTDALPKNS